MGNDLDHSVQVCYLDISLKFTIFHQRKRYTSIIKFLMIFRTF